MPYAAELEPVFMAWLNGLQYLFLGGSPGFKGLELLDLKRPWPPPQYLLGLAVMSGLLLMGFNAWHNRYSVGCT